MYPSQDALSFGISCFHGLLGCEKTKSCWPGLGASSLNHPDFLEKLLLFEIADRSMMRLESTELVKAHDASVNPGVDPGTVATLDGSRAINPH
jgi:hypothetical protein